MAQGNLLARTTDGVTTSTAASKELVRNTFCNILLPGQNMIDSTCRSSGLDCLVHRRTLHNFSAETLNNVQGRNKPPFNNKAAVWYLQGIPGQSFPAIL